MGDTRLAGRRGRVKGHGAGADNELGTQIAQEDIEEVMNAVAGTSVAETDAFLVIARELNRRYTEPVYGLGVLPSQEEGGIYHLNAARSLRTFIREVDNLVLFDNNAWRRSAGESLQMGYEYINGEIATRMGVMLSAGETTSPTPEMVVDASEIINTLACGGVSTIGYATSQLTRAHCGLFQRGSSKPAFESADTINQITTTVRQAALGRLTLPRELGNVRRALVIVAGPPEALSRRGIERAVSWLEEKTGSSEIRGGDYPIPETDKIGRWCSCPA